MKCQQNLDKWGAANGENDRYERFWRGLPPKSKGDYAFISHMVETTYTDPSLNGRVGVITPHGVLFRSGAEGKIRRALVEENLLDAIIGLPPNLFYGTGIPTAVLIFKRNKHDDTIFFIDASSEFEQGTNQNRLRDEDIEKIVTTYRARQGINRYAYLASFDEIKENDFNLNIARYVDTYVEEEQIDIQTVQKEILDLEDGLAEAQVKMANYLEELGYGA